MFNFNWFKEKPVENPTWDYVVKELKKKNRYTFFFCIAAIVWSVFDVKYLLTEQYAKGITGIILDIILVALIIHYYRLPLITFGLEDTDDPDEDFYGDY